MSGGEVFVVSGEPLWPSVHGGRIRTARIAEQIGRRLPVRVVAPLEGEPELDVPISELPDMLPLNPLTAAASPKPRLGQLLLDGRRRDVLQALIAAHRPSAVLFASSYLAAMLPAPDRPMVVDFADVEVRRMASLAGIGPASARGVHWFESIKACGWEPTVARNAALCTSPSESDLAVLNGWGARALLVSHGTDGVPAGPSPETGPVTYVASFSYAPNREAGSFVLQHVWPRLRRADPALQLRLVGRQADRELRTEAERAGAEVIADPRSVEPYYREASLVLAPVSAGGGAQLKVTEALGRGRLVVATPFSAASAPPAGRDGIVVAEGADAFADAVLRLWGDLDERRMREAALLGKRLPTWEEACSPLVEALVGVLSRT